MTPYATDLRIPFPIRSRIDTNKRRPVTASPGGSTAQAVRGAALKAAFCVMSAPAAILALSAAPALAADTGGYSLRPLAFFGGPAPGGGTFVNDLEPSAINLQGDVAVTADASTGREGVFTAAGGPRHAHRRRDQARWTAVDVLITT